MMIYAPWTQDEVDGLNAFQMIDYMHPFTCTHAHGDEDRRLIATTEGWVCRVPGCTYKQIWAHDFMLEAWAGRPVWKCADCALVMDGALACIAEAQKRCVGCGSFKITRVMPPQENHDAQKEI